MLSNAAAERILLTHFAQNPDTFFSYGDYLDDEDFVSEAHQQIFLALRKLYVTDKVKRASKASIVMAARELGFANFLSITKDGQILDSIMKTVREYGEDAAAMQAVKGSRLKRDYDAVLRDRINYLAATDDSPATIIQGVENVIYPIGSGFDMENIGPVKLCEGMEDALKEMAENPGHRGVDIGLPIWQHRVGHLRNGLVTFMVGTAKSGKSQFALRAALRAAYKLGLPVFYADSELNQVSQQVRLAGILAEIPYDIIEGGFWKLDKASLEARGMDDLQVAKVLEYGKRMRDPALWKRINNDIMPLIEYMPTYGMSVPDVLPHVKRWLMRDVKPDPDSDSPQCLLVYDYIKLATVDELRGGRVAEWQMHGLNLGALHDFGQKYSIPTLAFGQTNNEATDGPRCIAGGKRILENVDSASMLKRKSDEERAFDPTGSHFVKVWAARFGSATEVGHINMEADLSMGKFEELGYSAVNFAEQRRLRLEAARQNRRRNNGDDDDDDD